MYGVAILFSHLPTEYIEIYKCTREIYKSYIYIKKHVRLSTWMPRPCSGERKVFSTNGSGKTEYLCKRMRLYAYLMPCTKLIQNGLKT